MPKSWMSVVTVVLAGAVLVPGGLAEATAQKTRTDEARYETDPTQPGISAWFGENLGLFFGDAATFPARRRERFVSVAVEDDHGRPITAAVWQSGGDTTVICGASEDPIRIRGGEPVYVQVFINLTPGLYAGCAVPDLPTRGAITATFARR